jgi:hypothetical protein
MNLPRKPSILEAAASNILFPWRIDLGFKNIPYCNLGVRTRRWAQFAPDRPVEPIEETHVSLKR